MTQPMKFKSKPVEIEAMWFGTFEDAEHIVNWVNENSLPGTHPAYAFEVNEDAPDNLETIKEEGKLILSEIKNNLGRLKDVRIVVPTLEGDMIASPGWWIIRGTHGEFYPCKDDVFNTKYTQLTGPNGEDLSGNAESDSNLVKHARHELELLGEEPATIEGYLRVIQAFADMGHSGGSAAVAIPTINKLLQFKNLKPLTNNPDEWINHAPEMWDGTRGVWQNKRNGEAFSEDGGKTYYLLSEVRQPIFGDTGPVKTMHKSEEA